MSILDEKKYEKKHRVREHFRKKRLQTEQNCAIIISARGSAGRKSQGEQENAPLAQMDRAQASDAWCRRFESAMVRQKKALAIASAFFNEICPLGK